MADLPARWGLDARVSGPVRSTMGSAVKPSNAAKPKHVLVGFILQVFAH